MPVMGWRQKLNDGARTLAGDYLKVNAWIIGGLIVVSGTVGLVTALGSAPATVAAWFHRETLVERCTREVKDILRYWAARGTLAGDPERHELMDRCLAASLGR